MGEDASDSTTARPTCRFCLEDSVEEGDEFLAPCLCTGSMKYVHRSCLDQWRTNGFDPKTVTHCGTCKARFQLEQQDASALGAEGEVWFRIGQFLAWRIGIFLVVVAFLGFLPRWLLGADQTRIFANTVLNHLTMGTASTLALTGGWAVLQALWSLNILNLRLDRWGGGDKDSWFAILVILIIVGACILLYHVIVGIWEIATMGRDVATANLRHANRTMRRQIVQRYRVLNLDPEERCDGGGAAQGARPPLPAPSGAAGTGRVF